MRRLYDPEKPYFEAWLNLYDIDKGWYQFAGFTYEPRGSPLYYASLCGFRNLATHLVEKHPKDVNAARGQCLSPLAAALHERHFDIAELLYQRGAEVDVTGYRNRTLLHAALVGGLVDIAEWLLAHGADAMSQQEDCETPLHLAIKNQLFKIVRMLLRRDIFVDAKNSDDRTPLHLASNDGQVEIVQLLLQHGADIIARDRGNSTPLHLAVRVSDKLCNTRSRTRLM
jgi:ankyrin repeat protein